MFVASMLKKILWVAGYPCFPSKLLGPHKVGAIQTRIPPDLTTGVNCQIHYPATVEKQDTRRFTPYMRPRAVEGLAEYSRTNPALLKFLSERSHPCMMDADPLEGEVFPIVVFSHGLGGCMEMYTTLCQQIASCGFWVVALEHEDGSGAFAETHNGERIPYKRPDDSPYSRQKVLNFRRPFLKQRVQEITNVLDCILTTTTTENDSIMGVDEHVHKVLQAADRSKGVSFLGHSFGGSSVVMAVKEYLSEQNSLMQPASLSLLDPWAFSLEDKILQEGVPSIPILSILSESWLTSPELVQVEELLKSSEKATSFYAPSSVHASVADSVSWLPGFILRKLYMRGASEKRHETIRSVAKACTEHIRSSMIYEDTNLNSAVNYSPLRPFVCSVSDHVHAESTTLPVD